MATTGHVGLARAPEALPKVGSLHAVRSSAFLIGFSGVNILSGLVIQFVLARAFGATAAMDSFLVSIAVLTVLQQIVVATISPTLVPAMMRIEGGEREAMPLLRGFSLVVGSGVVLLAVGLVLFADPIVRAVAPGFRGEQAAEVAALIRIEAPSIVFFTFAAVGASILFSQQRFALPAASPAVNSVLVLLVSAVAIPVLGVRGAALGFSLGTVGQCAIFLPAFRRLTGGGGRWWDRGRLESVFRTLGPLILAAMLTKSYVLIERAIASNLPEGSVSYLGYSTKIFNVLNNLFVYSLAAYLLPQFSESIRRGRGERGPGAQVAYEMTMLLTAPLILGTIAISGVLVQLTLEHGAFGPEATREVSRTLWCYSVAALLMGGGAVISNVVYALQATAVMVRAALLSIALWVPAAIAGARFGHYGLALSLTIFAGAFLLSQVRYLAREVGLPLGRFLRFTGGDVLLGLFLWGAFVILVPAKPHGLVGYAGFVGLAGLGFAAHYGLLLLIHRRDRSVRKLMATFLEVWDQLRGRFGRPAGGRSRDPSGPRGPGDGEEQL